jgi:ParB-like chromosome segregation protein Spo0J
LIVRTLLKRLLDWPLHLDASATAITITGMEPIMPKTKPTKKIKYKPVLALPPLPPDQYQALRNNIAINGVLVPILVDSDGSHRKIIDGSHRKRIADELGYECPELVQGGLDESEKKTLARALNLARRHLSSEQKRQLIADQLEETPDWTNRRVAKMLGVSHPTVADVRAELDSVGKIYQLDRRVGSDGNVLAR